MHSFTEDPDACRDKGHQERRHFLGGAEDRQGRHSLLPRERTLWEALSAPRASSQGSPSSLSGPSHRVGDLWGTQETTIGISQRLIQ